MDKTQKGTDTELYLIPETEEDTKNETTLEAETDDIVLSEEVSPMENMRVSELRALRTENRKVFSMSDGTEQAVFYPEAVHMFDKETGELTEPDNTLILEDDNGHYRNVKGRFTAHFSCEKDNDELFSVEDDAHRVTVSVKRNKKQSNEGIIPKMRKRDEENSVVSDVVVFEDIHSETDFEYNVSTNGIKENIIVKKKSDIYHYPFILKCENVTPAFDEIRKRVVFFSNETGKEVFFIPAPFMRDALGEFSTAVSYELTNISEGNYCFTVAADSEWINSENRAFPVTIDPQINISSENFINSFTWNNGYVSEAQTHFVGVEGGLEKRMYIKMTPPVLPKNPRIKKAELKMFAHSGKNSTGDVAKIGLYEVTEDITLGNCTPAYNENLIDYVGIEETTSFAKSISFDVTKLIDKVYNGELSDLKLMVKFLEPTSSANLEFNGDAYSSLEFVVTYDSNYSINSFQQSNRHQLGRFGLGSIGLQSGNLMFESDDFTWGGNRMPVTIKHLYNSALSDYKYTTNSSIKLNVADFSSMNIGLGWKLNIMQSMIYDSQNDKYIYTDENGNEIYFKLSDKTTTCTVTSQCYNLYEDEDGNEFYYDYQNAALTIGETRYFFDSSGRLIKISEGNNAMQIVYSSEKLTSVIDGVGRRFEFDYNSSGNLMAITSPDYSSENKNQILYSYTGDLLTGITYPDGECAEIAYSGNKPISVLLKDKNGASVYKVLYAYSGNRINTVVELGVLNGEFKTGSYSNYSYSAASNRTVVTTTEPADTTGGTATVVTTVYTFDDDGNIIGQYMYTSNGSNTEVSGGEGINPYSSGMSAVSNVDNLLLNHNFDDLTAWTSQACGEIYINKHSNEADAFFCESVLRLQTFNEEQSQNGVYQQTLVLPAGDYTASAYIKTPEPFSTDVALNIIPGAYICVAKTDGTVLAESEHIFRSAGEYTRTIAPFTLSTEQSVKIMLLVDGKGTAYFDGIQLEKNSFANRYNMLTNSNFERELIGWESIGNASICEEEHFNMTHSLKVAGSLDSSNGVKQAVNVKSAKGIRENFTLSGWAKGCSLPNKERANCEPAEFSLSAVIKYTDGTEEIHTSNFSPCTDEWQPTTLQFAKEEFKEIENFTVCCNYNNNIGIAYFDDIRLFRNSIETGLSEADFASTEVDEKSVVYEEDETRFEEVKDDFGNILTETTFNDGEFGTIYRSFEYNDDGNDLISESDSRGNVTNYTVDEDTSRNEIITDRLGNKMVYEYDKSGKTTKVTNTTADGTEIASISYGYDSFNNLNEIVRSDEMKYALSYNHFHKLDSIGIDGKPQKLVTYGYKNGNGRLKEITYANGNKVSFTYNGYGQLMSENWSPSSAGIFSYKYIYDNSGNLVRTIDNWNGKEYNYLYENGRVIRAVEYNILSYDYTNVISKKAVNTIDYKYNSNGLLKRKMMWLESDSVEYKYEYPENSNPVVTVTSYDASMKSHSKTDAFGRKEFDELRLGTGFISRKFSYLEGEFTNIHKENSKLQSTPTTNLINQIVLSGGHTLSYTYDEEEHITSVTDSYMLDGIPVSDTVEYTYDALGQLTSETQNGVTIKYKYDSCGNILEKGICDETGEISETAKVTYAYGDTVWKDMLTTYNGQAITYDAQGNPLNYLGNTLTWGNGRQLQSFKNSAKGLNISYKYNPKGIRTAKTVNGTLHTYTIDGNKILKETYGGNKILSLYDNEDSICGIVYNGIPYYFQKNLQGDIIAITDQNGDIKARYSYDAWGKCTILQDSSDCLIATANPYRYRGYYFDSETDLYYLQSRYYDPETGRFINADSPEFVSITGGNLFTYCGNCPTKNADYFGFCYVPTYSSPSYSYGKKKKGFARDWLSLGIDIVATLLMPYAVAPYDVFGNAFAMFAKKNGIKLVWEKLLTTVVPKVVGVFSSFLTLIRTVIWRVTGALISNTIFAFISNFSGWLLSFEKNNLVNQLWLLVSMFFSFGSMVAGVLDLADGDFDGRISIFS